VPRGGNPVRLAFDDITHLLIQTERGRPLDDITESYGDYRSVGTSKAPFSIDVEESGDHERIRVRTCAPLTSSRPALFSPPPPPRDTVLTEAATIPLDSPGYAVVPARINGHDFEFILDTGGHNIVTPEVAAALGLKSDGQGTSGGSGPGRAAVSDTQVAKLELGGATMTNQHFTILDMGGAVKRKGKPDMAGILGLEVFERMAVTIDEPRHRLTIEPFRSGRRCEGDAIPLLFDDDQPAVRGTIDGIPAQIGIDVGNGGIPIVLWRWAEAHKAADRFRNGIQGNGSGVGGKNTTYRTSHHEIVVGRSALRDSDVNYATTSTGYFSSRADSMNLGHALLQKYIVRFDYAQKQMCVMPAANGAVAERASAE
jgi:Aspartyl protease